MHQSPQKYFAGRHEKYADLDIGDGEAERRIHRATQPKARKFPLREEAREHLREAKPNSRG